MGQSFKKLKIKLVDVTPPNPEFNYLWTHNEIICKRDGDFDVLLLGIRAEGWIVARVRLWPDFENSRGWRIFRICSPSINYSDSSSNCSDSGIQQQKMFLEMNFDDLKQVYFVYKNGVCETCFAKSIFVVNKMTRLYPLQESERKATLDFDP